MKILAFDLALNHFGWALVDSDWETPDEYGAELNPYDSPKYPMGQRLDWIVGQTSELLELEPDEVWKEAAVGASFQVLKLAPVHGIFDHMLWVREEAIPHEVSPRSIKVLATNDGGTKTNKAAMIAAAGIYLGFVRDPEWKGEMTGDAADALWVADYAARLHNIKRPALPAKHLRALVEGKEP